MGVCRNTFGRLSYTLTNKKGVFSVSKGDNRIIKHYPYYNTDARIDTGLVIGDEIPRFDSFIRAARFMVENKEVLI